MEEILQSAAGGVSLICEGMAVLIIAFGALEAFAKILRLVLRRGTTHGERKAVWRRFGVWLLLGLEFELAADIVGTIIAPSWMDLGELGAIAVIRTFLNYFLEKDLEQAEEEGEIAPDEAR